MSIPFIETGAPPIKQPQLLALKAEYRLQGGPLVRWVPRQTQGGGFGNLGDHPFAWGIWVMADGQWRRIVSARGLPREWSSLDRLEAWLHGLGFASFTVSRDDSLDPEHSNS